MADSLIEPKNSATTAPAIEPVSETPPATQAQPDASATQEAALPEELVQIPAIQAIVVGQPPALSASIKDFATRPEGKLIAANKDPLLKAGMGLYRSLSGDVGVLFNRFYLTDEDLVTADKAGKLTELAPSFDEVNSLVSKAGPEHPVLAANSAPPTSFKAPSGNLPPQVSPAPASVPAGGATKPNKAAQIQNLNPGSPTSGPQPGAGRILNNILKPVI